MRKVLTRSTTQPNQNTAQIADAAMPPSMRHRTGSAIGRHCQSRSAIASVAKSTYVLRSMRGGTTRVHHCLNERRAITLCCAANSKSRHTFTMSACASGAGAPLSIDFGTGRLPMKPIV